MNSQTPGNSCNTSIPLLLSYFSLLLTISMSHLQNSRVYKFENSFARTKNNKKGFYVAAGSSIVGASVSALVPVVVEFSGCPEDASDGKVSCASPKTTSEDLHMEHWQHQNINITHMNYWSVTFPH